MERDGNLKAGVEEQSAGKGPRQGGREDPVERWGGEGEGLRADHSPQWAGGMAAFITNSPLALSCTPTSPPPDNLYFLNGLFDSICVKGL